MPDPLSHHPAMLIIKPDSMPRFWWLVPWAYARQLHRNCVALKALCDRQDDLLKGNYTERPRYAILPHTHEGVTRYYFHDTDPTYDRGRAGPHVIRGKCLLYDGYLKQHVTEEDPAKAIETVTHLNTK